MALAMMLKTQDYHQTKGLNKPWTRTTAGQQHPSTCLSGGYNRREAAFQLLAVPANWTKTTRNGEERFLVSSKHRLQRGRVLLTSKQSVLFL